MKCEPWQVWWANVRYEDSNEVKNRPVLILDTEKMIAVALKMTSHEPRRGDYALLDWKGAGLRQQTCVRFNQKLELEEDVITNQIGALSLLDKLNIMRILKLFQ